MIPVWHCLYLILKIKFDKRGLNQLFSDVRCSFAEVYELLKHSSYQKILSATTLYVSVKGIRVKGISSETRPWGQWSSSSSGGVLYVVDLTTPITGQHRSVFHNPPKVWFTVRKLSTLPFRFGKYRPLNFLSDQESASRIVKGREESMGWVSYLRG